MTFHRFYVMFLTGICLTALTTAHAQSGSNDQGPVNEPQTRKSEQQKNSASKKPRITKRIVRDEPKANYRHELNGSLSYDMSNGSTTDIADNSKTELKQSIIGAGVSYGYIVDDHLEPIIELQFRQDQRTVDNFTSNDQVMDVGFGLLVNLPVAGRPSSPREAATNWDVPDFMRAKWIPYVGFLAGYNSNTAEQGESNQSKFTDQGTFTKVIFGTRYLVFDHVALNSSVRILYESNKSSAEDSNVSGADGSKLRVEARLFSISLLL